jgi:hypothetical protein
MRHQSISPLPIGPWMGDHLIARDPIRFPNWMTLGKLKTLLMTSGGWPIGPYHITRQPLLNLLVSPASGVGQWQRPLSSRLTSSHSDANYSVVAGAVVGGGVWCWWWGFFRVIHLEYCKIRCGTWATTRYLYVVCIYGAICLQILFLKHNILLFCHEILNFFLHKSGHNRE